MTVDRVTGTDGQTVNSNDEQLRHGGLDQLHDTGRPQQDRPGHPSPPPKQVHRVSMNYHPLTLSGHKLTGLQIKEQAITAGIPNIGRNFYLTVERAGHDAEHAVGDADAWVLRDGDCFTAVTPDDNS